MRWLTQETIAFLRDLSQNNSREWFKANEERYKAHYKWPAQELAGQLAEELARLTGKRLEAKVFRLHRDVRFSKDKTPYNTHLRIAVSPLDPTPSEPMWMAGIELDRLVVGVGSFAFPKPVLERYRHWIDGAQGDRFAALLDTQAKRGARLREQELKRVPAPYPADHRHADLLRYKGFSLWFDHDGADMALGDDGVSNITASLMELKPVYDWLAELAA
ncbi:MAG: DUF2461 domain-containing protein [Sphingomonadaceae bacterium]|jgi:uncharacterized protein (TIGR02453 family)|nr:DUF2461 domain-containing protein [Sphingomonadaceae bacterium]